MDDVYWERCPFYAEDECPNTSLVDRAHLIPHLLSSSEMSKVKQTCEKCGLYLNEKRKYIRLRKPFRVAVITDKRGTRLQGKIINVSGVGALIMPDTWSEFAVNQEVELEIYSRPRSSKDKNEIVIKVSAVIKRVNDKDKRVAVMFLEELQQDYLLAL
jgi:phenylpyruvate tautomerase PptA (4-oxalocrotonate tautomerase family)